MEKKYRLLKTYECPTGKIHIGVSKTEKEWQQDFPKLLPGDCKIKTDWFSPIEGTTVQELVNKYYKLCTALEGMGSHELVKEFLKDLENL